MLVSARKGTLGRRLNSGPLIRRAHKCLIGSCKAGLCSPMSLYLCAYGPYGYFSGALWDFRQVGSGGQASSWPGSRTHSHGGTSQGSFYPGPFLDPNGFAQTHALSATSCTYTLKRPLCSFGTSTWLEWVSTGHEGNRYVKQFFRSMFQSGPRLQRTDPMPGLGAYILPPYTRSTPYKWFAKSLTGTSIGTTILPLCLSPSGVGISCGQKSQFGGKFLTYSKLSRLGSMPSLV